MPEADKLTWCIGPPLLESFATLAGSERAADAVALYRERYFEIGLYENTMYAGVVECLTALAEGGFRLGLASSKPQVLVDRLLEHFGLTPFFEGIFGSELDGTRTDKTELLGFALQETGLDARACAMVGDRKYDVIGARDNGIEPIAVLYGYGSRAELEEAGAGVFLADIGELASRARR